MSGYVVLCPSLPEAVVPWFVTDSGILTEETESPDAIVSVIEYPALESANGSSPVASVS